MNEIATVACFPRKVREIENAWIEMPDGTRLAARIWLPEDAEADPVPAILEYLPYRKRDGTAEIDARNHPYFAGHGYAGVRVDMRGTGDSDGVLRGEYLLQEQLDCMSVIEWLAGQPWCSGAVGMIGISWGGFNGLQVAARRPPALKAVVTVCSTDDRYATDIHFAGGALLTEKLAWGATVLAITHAPPDPRIVGERWREIWLERLRGNGCWLIDWFRHQRRDAFWRHGSICEDWSAIDVPVLVVGGWADGYTDAVLRMLANLPGPRKGMIGPWAHDYPHLALPGPRIGFLQECLRWWDQHLKGLETGVMDGPMLRAWVQEPAPPSPAYAVRPGRWVGEAEWPAPDIIDRALTLAPGRLVKGDAPSTSLSVRSPQTTGLSAGRWCAYGNVPDGPLDQREEDGGSLLFVSDPLGADLDLLGVPVLEAEVSADRPVASIIAVLSAVTEHGAVTPVSTGTLNLTHRRSHTEPEPMLPDRPEQVLIQLSACGQRFAAGTRLRLAITSAWWPTIWPAPEAATLTVTTGVSRLILPVRPPRVEDATLPAPLPPEAAPPLRVAIHRPGGFVRRVIHDQATGEITFERTTDAGEVHHLDTNLILSSRDQDRLIIQRDDPATARGECLRRRAIACGGWRTEVEVTVSAEARPDVFRVTALLRAASDEGVEHEATWEEDIPRDGA